MQHLGVWRGLADRPPIVLAHQIFQVVLLASGPMTLAVFPVVGVQVVRMGPAGMVVVRLLRLKLAAAAVVVEVEQPVVRLVPRRQEMEATTLLVLGVV